MRFQPPSLALAGAWRVAVAYSNAHAVPCAGATWLVTCAGVNRSDRRGTTMGYVSGAMRQWKESGMSKKRPPSPLPHQPSMKELLETLRVGSNGELARTKSGRGGD